MDTTTNAAPTVPSTSTSTSTSTSAAAPQGPPDAAPSRITVRRPAADDGAAMWRVARDSQVLDLNSSYAYLLLAQHFADTCRVAVVDDEVVGFLSAYRLPDDADRLFVWQVAVDEAQRGRGVAGLLLDAVVDPASGLTSVLTTVAEDNVASRALFVRWAARRDATITTRPLFTADQFPDAHEDEPMLVIEGLRAG